jgi:hypothetical protein
MIQIHDSKKKGEYFVRLVAKNGKILSNSETLTSKANVLKNIIAQDKCFSSNGEACDLNIFMTWAARYNTVNDHTALGYFAKKYGCKSGLKKLSRSSK